MKREPLLVRLPNPVGDAVATTPLLDSIHESLPRIELVAAGRARACELLEGIGSVDRFVPFDGSGVRAQARTMKSVGARLCLLLPNSWSSALAARLARIPYVIGRRGQGRGMILHESLPPIPGPAPMKDLYLELAPLVGATPSDRPARLAVTDQNESDASERCEAGGWNEHEKPFLGVAPGAAFGPSKIYPLDMMCSAVKEARERTSLVPLLLGGPGEESLLAELASRLGQPFLSTHERPAGLGELKALLTRCRTLLTMDTGPRHIAAALGVPQVVLFGPTDPRWSAAGLEQTTVMRRTEVDCSPCHKKVCPIDHRCLARIEPSNVALQVELAAAASR